MAPKRRLPLACAVHPLYSIHLNTVGIIPGTEWDKCCSQSLAERRHGIFYAIRQICGSLGNLGGKVSTSHGVQIQPSTSVGPWGRDAVLPPRGRLPLAIGLISRTPANYASSQPLISQAACRSATHRLPSFRGHSLSVEKGLCTLVTRDDSVRCASGLRQQVIVLV